MNKKNKSKAELAENYVGKTHFKKCRRDVRRKHAKLQHSRCKSF